MAIYLRTKGRTSPPAKTIGHRESISPTLPVLKLVAKYPVTTIYSNMQHKKRPIVSRRKIAKKPELTFKGDEWKGGEVDKNGKKLLKIRTTDSLDLLSNPDWSDGPHKCMGIYINIGTESLLGMWGRQKDHCQEWKAHAASHKKIGE